LRPGTLWKVLFGLALGLIFVAVVTRKVELDRVWIGLTGADPIWVALTFLSVLLTTAAKICRWQRLFPRTRQPGLLQLGKALLVGQLFNALLPARIGDVVRAYAVGEEGKVSRATALGTVAAEKAFDVLFLLLSGGLAALLVRLPPWLAGPLTAGTMVGALLFVLALLGSEKRLSAWFRQWACRLPWGSGERLVGVLQRVSIGLTALHKPQMALTACAWSAAIWTLAAGTNYLLFQAFELRLPATAALSLLVLLHVGVAPPSSPGRLGVFHALTVLGLEAFGVDRSPGLAYATILHAIVYLPQIVPGAIICILNRRKTQQAAQ